METVEQYLFKYKEKMPSWLNTYKKGDKINLDILLSSRTFFYPGSGFDGVPIKIINSAEYCHIFIYVDNGYSKKRVESELPNFKGYSILDKLNLKGDKWEFAILTIYEKLTNSDVKGANRFALLYIKDDAFNVYRYLYGHNNHPSIILAENYMGENAEFGLNSPLEKLANNHQIPLLITNGNPWEHYEKVDAKGFTYEKSGLKRYLYKINDDSKDFEERIKKYMKEHKDLMDALAD